MNVKLLLLAVVPLLERRAIGDREARQEVAVVQLGGLVQELHAGGAAIRPGVLVGDLAVEQRPKGRHVDRVWRIGPELDGLPRDQQKRRGVAKCLAQLVERPAQVRARVLLGVVGLEQPGQGAARMGPIAFHGQIGEQRANLVGLEAGHDLPVDSSLKLAHQHE